ncbi:hypothetical protein K0M31_013078 [Melipona bicolor]|uniref:Uncharacterized protein n=1 Tax=Melipona bicolor TaxID=60889 RepID=A0AA40FIT9_9HYME|nr:hypothetical protein K0M31_013078 [Melipona bicolor]
MPKLGETFASLHVCQVDCPLSNLETLKRFEVTLIYFTSSENKCDVSHSPPFETFMRYLPLDTFVLSRSRGSYSFHQRRIARETRTERAPSQRQRVGEQRATPGTEVSSSRSPWRSGGSGINSPKPSRTGLNPNYEQPWRNSGERDPRFNFIPGNELRGRTDEYEQVDKGRDDGDDDDERRDRRTRKKIPKKDLLADG